ncbi:hypothetical protein [Sphingobacterium bambusae]|uniref:VanZ-like domain-containing protein n=1 Tax=Sphingobacterium bambusae TaxID=662858 RepID=A0ABW6BJ27_9SPHI|nr:hypothetical protein [Sphingobacterium bambusae]WPL50287.1 hypothetical protein SCB77_07480 [Sphingobacterium bambusae]
MEKMNVLKYAPKLPAAIAYIVLLVLVMLLFFGRKTMSLRPAVIVEHWPDFYLHVSNFSISYLMLGGIGFMWILIGIPTRFLVVCGMLLIGCNFVYELWVPILNTPDVVDAYYGVAGTILALCFLLCVKRFGLVPLTKESET